MTTNHLNECDKFLNTTDVALETDTSAAEAREWAAENGVQRVGNAFIWTAEDVEDYEADLDEEDEEDQDEDDQDDEDQDEDDQDDEDQDDEDEEDDEDD